MVNFNEKLSLLFCLVHVAIVCLLSHSLFEYSGGTEALRINHFGGTVSLHGMTYFCICHAISPWGGFSISCDITHSTIFFSEWFHWKKILININMNSLFYHKYEQFYVCVLHIMQFVILNTSYHKNHTIFEMPKYAVCKLNTLHVTVYLRM